MKKKIITISILLVLFIATFIIKLNTSWCDFIVVHISSYVYNFLNLITSFIPFTIYELFIIFCVIFAIVLIILIIKNLIKKQRKKALNILMNGIIFALVCVDAYSYLFSLGYQRSALPIDIYNEEVTDELINDTTSYFLEDYNSLAEKLTFEENGALKAQYTLEELNNLINLEYEKLDDDYFVKINPKAKYIVSSSLYSEMHITGVTFCLTGEMMVNKDLSPIELPHTLAHESAHAHGVMRENDANLLASYILINSNNDYLRYCGYFATFSSLLDIYYYTDREAWSSLWKEVNYNTYLNYKLVNEFWKSKDKIEKFGDWFNNLYLTFNGNKNGTADYDDNEEKEDTGTTDASNNPIYTITTYSPYQRLLFETYLNRQKKN